jgi:heme-degrading monooxygenase HmoA
MFLAIFEVHPKAERFDGYLALAKRLKPILEKIDGFVDNERFESKRRPGWILSLSTWRDEVNGSVAHHGGAPHRPEAGPLRNSPGLPLENR